MNLVVSFTAALEWLKAVTHLVGHTDDTGILVRCWDYLLPLLGLPTWLRLGGSPVCPNRVPAAIALTPGAPVFTKDSISVCGRLSLMDLLSTKQYFDCVILVANALSDPF